MKLIANVMLMAMLSGGAAAQSLLHPVSATDGGGGRSSGAGLNLLGSVGQSSAGTGSDGGTGLTMEVGIIPPLRNGSGALTTADILVQSAWNMISLPVSPPNPKKSTLLPTAISSAFAYLPPPTGYLSRDSLYPGIGYWAKFPGVGTIQITGTALASDTIEVFTGWNLIGSLTYPSQTSEVVPIGGTTVLSSYFAFTPGFGYTSRDTLEPGRAYWVKVDQAGALLLNSGSFPIPPAGPASTAAVHTASPGDHPTASVIPADAGTVTFRAADGQTRALYITVPSPEIALAAHELPPVPPGGIFDVRFASQRTLETIGPDGSAPDGAAVLITGAEWPVTVSYEGGSPGLDVTLGVLNKDGDRLYHLSAGGNQTLEVPALVTLQARNGGLAPTAIPTVFRLYQNYPNPFNPTTTVTFDLPEPASVTLVITNSIGQTVRTIVDEPMVAGRHAIAVDGSGLPTGVYLYRITAGNRSAMKKMLLMK